MNSTQEVPEGSGSVDCLVRKLFPAKPRDEQTISIQWHHIGKTQDETNSFTSAAEKIGWKWIVAGSSGVRFMYFSNDRSELSPPASGAANNTPDVAAGGD